MNKKRLFFTLSLFLFVAGLFLLLSSKINITGSFIGTFPTALSSSLGALFFLILGFLCLIEGTLEEKIRKDPMKHLRRYVNDYTGDFLGLISYVTDILAQAKPKMGFVSSQALKKEKRELEYLAKKIANKYHIGKRDVYEMISEDLHPEKRKYGRKGR